VCVQGVITAPRVHQRSQRDVHGVRLRSNDADVLVYDISVSTYCGNFRASVKTSLLVGTVWALAPGLERRGVCVPFLDAWGRPLPIPHVPWEYTAVGLHTMQEISDKLRELKYYDNGASAVNQALHSMQDTL